jgi:enoyl-CoA hydratase/carnithine racemase
MAVVESERHGQVLVVRMNHPERLNALNGKMRTVLAEIWTEFRHDKDLEVANFTGAGRGFCASEDRSLASGTPAASDRPFQILSWTASWRSP